jgi:polyhydroxyalkanoate synthesis regulator phasin
VPEGPGKPPARAVTEALRAAIERTLSVAAEPARVGSAAATRERATKLLDEVARRGREARDELARRSQEAGAALGGRRGEAEAEIAARLAEIERRVAELERSLRTASKPKAEG